MHECAIEKLHCLAIFKYQEVHMQYLALVMQAHISAAGMKHQPLVICCSWAWATSCNQERWYTQCHNNSITSGHATCSSVFYSIIYFIMNKYNFTCYLD